ncbi:filamentous hemagglutinin family N-terminal domain protein [Rivularia sp. PCC 7116]|uniref:beta strand repeat-containing protein n=1 Tax=Rivularia sp. PCC 7116 TaxID=373994 RepID=UPI00029F328B|nr:filamentous hemagglutinin N-terminal domain-containing protein [Rivularia sp. PCC 7116]AFY57418.1 filamentous hemagglutinin family N-terminal domain protein [Rivularia sp. PCC 7116]
MGANWQYSNKKLCFSVPLITAIALTFSANTVVAQVTPDQSQGKENSVVTPVNPNTERIDGGAVRGSNLFHSFKEFNVGERQRVDFASPTGVENIFSRVTGNNSSNIFGTLGVLGNANLFLLNPNGIIFGPNARLDIRGSFVASTGKGVNFEDRILFGANNLESKPLLTMAVPVGLQYGTQQAGNINNEGNLQVGEGQKLALAGNTVTTSGKMTAPGGTVHVLGERVGLLDNAQIDVSGETGGGNVLIGGDFQGKGEVPNAKRTFVGSGANIIADALTSGDGGRVIVWADETTGFNGNISARGGSQFGNGGFAEVSGKENLAFQGKVDLSANNGQFGSLLLDPTNITIVEGGNNPSELAANNEFADSGVNNTIKNSTINAATANVILQASNDITFDAPVNIAANGVELTAEANNNINVNANITSNRGNVTLDADKDNSGAGSLIITNAAINTNGGDFAGSGKGSNASTSGINLTNSEINAAGGNIQVIGRGKDGGSDGKGINIDGINGNSVIETTGAGNITLTGTSGAGSCAVGLECRNHGIFVGNSQVKTENGKIRFIGKGASSNGDVNHGIAIWSGGLVESTGTGAIDMTSTTEAKTNNNVYGNDAISVVGGGIVKTITGDITMTGIGGNDGGETDGNQGIVVLDPNSKVTSVSGDISLAGTGRGVGDNHYGIWIGRGNGGEVTSENGNITLNGKGGGTGKNNIGVYLNESGLVKTTGEGNITLDGTSGTGSCSENCENHGIKIFNDSKVSSKDGKISFIGKGASSNGDINHGVYILLNGLVESTGAGSIEMTGTTEATASTSNNSVGNEGISIVGGGKVISEAGNITMTGTGGNGESEMNGNQGILVLDPNSEITSVSGDISLTGTARGIGSNNHGIWIGDRTGIEQENNGKITSENGNITLIGQGGGTNVKNIGIFLDGNGVVSTVGTGKIVLNGTGGNGTNENHGILVQGNSKVSSVNGDIDFSGKGGGNATDGSKNNGISIFNRGVVETTGTGRIVLNGIVSNENDNNAGIRIQDLGSQIFSSGGGDINLVAESISLIDDGQVRASTINATDAVKKGGDILVNASDTLEVLNGGRLRSQTSGTSNAGNITIDTSKLDVRYSQSDPFQITGIGTDTRPESSGDGGNLSINATESVTISGNDPTPFNPSPTVGNLILAASTRTGITASTLGSGKAGNLIINTKRLTIQDDAGAATASLSLKENAEDGGVLTVNATESIELKNLAGLATATIGSGNAGNLIVNSGQINLTGGAVFSADTFNSGKGGNLIITTNELNVLSGSRIGAATVGEGSGGNIKVNTLENKAQLVKVDGVSANGEVSSSLTASSQEGGKAGDLNISTKGLEVLNGGQIAVSSTGENSISGNMLLTADSLLLKNQASINALTSTQGEGGDININVANNIDFEGRDSEISSEAFGNASGGNLTIDVGKFIKSSGIPNNNDIVVTADGRGVGGKLSAKAKGDYGFVNFDKVRTPDSDFTAASRLGQDGTLSLITDNPEPQLPQQPNTPEIVQVCPSSQGVTTRTAGRSEFINTGHGGLPPSPNEALESNTAQVPWVTLNPQENKPTTASKPKVIREAQGWVKMPNGKLLLTTRKSNSSSSSCVFQSN